MYISLIPRLFPVLQCWKAGNGPGDEAICVCFIHELCLTTKCLQCTIIWVESIHIICYLHACMHYWHDTVEPLYYGHPNHRHPRYMDSWEGSQMISHRNVYSTSELRTPCITDAWFGPKWLSCIVNELYSTVNTMPQVQSPSLALQFHMDLHEDGWFTWPKCQLSMYPIL